MWLTGGRNDMWLHSVLLSSVKKLWYFAHTNWFTNGCGVKYVIWNNQIKVVAPLMATKYVFIFVHSAMVGISIWSLRPRLKGRQGCQILGNKRKERLGAWEERWRGFGPMGGRGKQWWLLGNQREVKWLKTTSYKCTACNYFLRYCFILYHQLGTQVWYIVMRF